MDRGINIIQAYGAGRFRVGMDVHDYPLLVSATHLSRWQVGDVSSMTLESLAAFINHDPPLEIIVFGTGASLHSIPHALRAALKEKNLKVEVMDTGAACRTYHVLLAEKRRVGAAVLLIEFGP